MHILLTGELSVVDDEGMRLARLYPVITDTRMPHMDGTALLKAIRDIAPTFPSSLFRATSIQKKSPSTASTVSSRSLSNWMSSAPSSTRPYQRQSNRYPRKDIA